MTYRDDRDALHARTEALEAEVAALRAQQEQSARLHERELEAALQGQRPIRVVLPSRRQRVHPGAAIALVAASALAFTAVMTVRAVRHAPQVASAGPAHAAFAVWEAKVVTAEGMELAPGTKCTILSKMELGAGDPAPSAPVIHCGDLVPVYDPGMPLGASRASFSAEERFAPTSDSATDDLDLVRTPRVFDLVYNEAGELDRPLPALALDTARGVAVLSRGEPALQIELAVTPQSRPVLPGW